MLFGALVARPENGGYIPVVVGKAFHRPLGSAGLRHSVGIEQIPHAHDVLVALVCFVNDALFCQFAGSGSNRFLQPPVTDRGFGGLLFLVAFQFDGHGGGVGIEVDVGVVCQSAEPRDILAFQVAFASQQVGIIAVALLEDFGIDFPVLLRSGRQAVRTVDNAKPRTADSGVGQQRMLVGADTSDKFRQAVGVDMVDVCQRQRSPAHDVLCLLAASEAHGNGKTRAGGFLPCSGSLLPVMTVIAVFLGTVAHQCIVADKVYDFL